MYISIVVLIIFAYVWASVGTIVEKRSVSIARKWIGMGCVTDMEHRNAVTVNR